MDVLLEAIATSAMDATGVAFDFSAAHVERLDARGHAKPVVTDSDCAELRGAPVIRVFTSKRCRERLRRKEQHAPSAMKPARTSAAGQFGSVLLAPVREADEEEGVELLEAADHGAMESI